jgi:rhodanese-related sulfurtransferase
MRMLRVLIDQLGRRAARRARTPELSAAVLRQWLAEGRGIQLLDIREAAAFRQGHLPGARHVPLDRLEQELSRLERGRATVVY